LDQKQGYNPGPITPYINWVKSYIIPDQTQN